MKANFLSIFTIPALGVLASCTPPANPPAAPPLTSPDAFAQGSNPYGVPGVPQANPYGAPTPSYTPEAAAPYQPINPPAAAPYSPPAPAAYTPPTPTYNPAPAAGAAAGATHTIVKGESLWGISRKYGVTVDDLRQANSMTGDTIIEGKTLIIPGQ